MSKQFEKVTGYLSVSIDCECPNCQASIDLFNDQEAGDVNIENEIWDILFKGNTRDGWSKLNVEVKCQFCKHVFTFEELAY